MSRSATRTLVVPLLVLGLLLHTASSQAVADSAKTGWSNGADSSEKPTLPEALCPDGSFIRSWLIGEGKVASSLGPLLSVVSVQGQCSDGMYLPALTCGTKVEKKHDYESDSSLRSAKGYTCAQLFGYNNRGNWMMNFLGVGQALSDDPAGTPLKLNCGQVPPAHVAVGYSGRSFGALDALNFVMAPLPELPSPTPSPGPSPAPSPSPVVVPPVPSPPPSPQSPLGIGAIIGIAASAFVGVSALLTMAYTSWKWWNKRKLVAAKGYGDVAAPHEALYPGKLLPV